MKKLIYILLLLPFFTSGQSLETKSPTEGTNDNSVGDFEWLNPGRITASDNSRTVIIITGEVETYLSNYLKALDFEFSIPAGANIDGVIVEIEKYSFSSDGVDSYVIDDVVKLVKGGVVSGDNKVNVNKWPTTEQYVSYGASNNLWGLLLSADDVNAVDFGVVLQCTIYDYNYDGAVSARVDHVRITVYFTESGGEQKNIFMGINF